MHRTWFEQHTWCGVWPAHVWRVGEVEVGTDRAALRVDHRVLSRGREAQQRNGGACRSRHKEARKDVNGTQTGVVSRPADAALLCLSDILRPTAGSGGQTL